MALAVADDGAPLTIDVRARVDRPMQVLRRGRDMALIDPDNERIGCSSCKVLQKYFFILLFKCDYIISYYHLPRDADPGSGRGWLRGFGPSPSEMVFIFLCFLCIISSS